MPRDTGRARTEDRADLHVRPAHRGVLAAFVSHGLVFGAWAPRIPAVRARLGLSDGGLGLALLGAPVGVLAGQFAGGLLVGRIGSRTTTRAALVGACLAPILAGVATSGAELFAALALWGFFLGGLDLAMNAAGIAVEDAAGRRLFAGLHASWSMGALAGTGVGAGAAALGVPVGTELAVVGTACAVGGSWLARHLIAAPAVPERRAPGPLRRGLTRTLLLVGLLAALDLLCEGIAGDWSAVYLRDRLGASAGLAGTAYAAFLAAMLAGRLVGDRLAVRAGAARTVRRLSVLATAGMAGCLVAGALPAAVAGFLVLGLGLSCTVPFAYAAGGRAPGLGPGKGLAVVTTFGYTSYLLAPPLVGGLATVLSLPVALGVIPLATAGIAALAPNLER